MSWRVWLGNSKANWAETQRRNFANIERVCKSSAWETSVCVYAETTEQLVEYFTVCHKMFGFDPPDFKYVGLLPPSGEFPAQLIPDEDLRKLPGMEWFVAPVKLTDEQIIQSREESRQAEAAYWAAYDAEIKGETE